MLYLRVAEHTNFIDTSSLCNPHEVFECVTKGIIKAHAALNEGPETGSVSRTSAHCSSLSLSLCNLIYTE